MIGLITRGIFVGTKKVRGYVCSLENVSTADSKQRDSRTDSQLRAAGFSRAVNEFLSGKGWIKIFLILLQAGTTKRGATPPLAKVF